MTNASALHQFNHILACASIFGVENFTQMPKRGSIRNAVQAIQAKNAREKKHKGKIPSGDCPHTTEGFGYPSDSYKGVIKQSLNAESSEQSASKPLTSPKFSSNKPASQGARPPTHPTPHASLKPPAKRQKTGKPSAQEDKAQEEDHWVHFDPPESSHTTRRIRNAAAWDEKLPLLTYPLMEAFLQMSLNDHSVSPLWLQPRCSSSCQNSCLERGETRTVRVILFGREIPAFSTPVQYSHYLAASGIDIIQLPRCPGVEPSVVLIEHGCFPSTPSHFPKWAFDIHLLEFSALHFKYSTPNMSAWCHSTISFMKWRQVPNPPTYVCPERHVLPSS
jgi:hypothetical protein